MATVLQFPDSLSLAGNIKDIILSSAISVNFKIKEGAVIILEENYDPDVDNTITIRLRDILPSLLKSVIPTSNVFEQTEAYKTFTFEIDAAPTNCVVVSGGVDASIDALTFLKANWLSWQPQQKNVKYTDPEWLSYYATEAVTVKLKAYFKDDPAETINLTSLAANKFYSLNVMFQYLSGLFTTAQPVYFDIWTEDATFVQLSFIQRYVLMADYFEFDDLFVFENTLGGVDTVRLTGNKEENNQFDISSVLIDEDTTDYDVEYNQVFLKNTGYFSSARERSWLNEFLNSIRRYFVTPDGLKSVTISKPEAKVDPSDASSFNYEFNFALSRQTKFLNFPRVDELPDVVEIIDPATELFFLAPRLVEFPIATLDDLLLFPVQMPFIEEWKQVSYAAIKSDIISAVIGTPLSHSHDNLNDLDLLSVSSGYLLIDAIKVKAGDSDKLGGIAAASYALTTHNHDTVYEPLISKSAGYAKWTGSAWSFINETYLLTSLKGAANGLAELDATGRVPSGQLPSYVDDVLEYANLAAFPATGETSSIYVALDTNLIYRWSGTAYVEISASLALGETSSTAYRGDRGKIAYDHSQVSHVSVANQADNRLITATGTSNALNGEANLAFDGTTLKVISASSEATMTATGTKGFSLKGISGTGWINGYSFYGSAGTYGGQFGAYGVSDVIDSIYIGRDNTDRSARFFMDGAAELYYDNLIRFKTSSTGVVCYNASTAFLIDFSEAGTNRGYLGFGDAGNIFGSADADSMGLRATGSLHLGSGSTIGITVKATTNDIGIGTTTPGTITGTAFTGKFLHLVNTGGLGRIVSEGSTGGQLILVDNSAAINKKTWILHSSAGNVSIGSMLDNGSATTRLTILNNGYVGVGVSANNPYALFHVGTASVRSDANGTQTVRFTTQIGGAGTIVDSLHIDCYPSTAFNNGVAISFGYKGVAADYTSRIIHWGNAAATAATKLQFQTMSSTAGVWNYGIMIGTLGYVGIGLDPSTHWLEVGSIATGGTFKLTGKSGISYGIIFDNTPLNFTVSQANPDDRYFNITSTSTGTFGLLVQGKLGVGTTTPSYKAEFVNTNSGAGENFIRVSKAYTATDADRVSGIILGPYFGSANLHNTWTIESRSANGYMNASDLNFIWTASSVAYTRMKIKPDGNTYINGGLHIGGISDAGDNNLLVDGTLGITGVSTFTDHLVSPTFVSGFTGSGWKIDKVGTKYNLTVDNLTVREALTAYELDINKINSVNGGMVVSVANGTCLTVSGTTIYFDEDGTNKQIQFVVDDYIRAQIWTGRGINSYVGRVTAVTHSATYGVANIVATTISGTPWNGMELVQIGNATVTSRQNLIYITASDSNNPYIDMLAGVDTGDFAGKQKLRIGNLTGITDADFGGALTGYGLYANNIYLKGNIVMTGGSVPNANVAGLGSLATKSSVDLSTAEVTNKSLANVDSTANTKLAGIATGATVGATWGTDLNSIPATLGAPSGSGLFLSSTHMGYYTASAWKTYIAADGTFAFSGDANNYVTWNGTTLSIKGNVILTAGSVPNSLVTGLGSLAVKSSVDLATAEVTNKSLANVDSTANTKLAGIATGATVGATWGTDLNSIPATLGAPSGSGLFLSSTHMGYYTASAWKTYIAADGTFAFSGDANNYVTWNGTTLSIKGNVIITAGSVPNSLVTGLGSLATKSSVDLSTVEVTNKSLFNVDSAASTKLSGIANGATVGATWGVNLGSIPATLGAPSGTGLFLSSTYMGFYTASAWKTYIDNVGNLILGDIAGGNTGMSWSQAAGTLTIKGAITATSGVIGGFTSDPTDGFYAGTGATRVQMKPGAGFWAGATAIADAPFSVTQAGAVKATSGVIGGWTIGTDAIYTGTKKITDGFSTDGITMASDGSLHAESFFINADGSINIRTSLGSTYFELKGDTFKMYNGGVESIVLDSDATRNIPALKLYNGTYWATFFPDCLRFAGVTTTAYNVFSWGLTSFETWKNLKVKGGFTLEGHSTTSSTTYTLLNSDSSFIYLSGATAAVTVNLPASGMSVGQIHVIVNATTAWAITVQGNGNTIYDGGASYTSRPVGDRESFSFMWNGSCWSTTSYR